MFLERLFDPIMKISIPVFEPMLPVFLDYYLNKKLDEWKETGAINNFRIKTSRKGKFNYRIDADFLLTEAQTKEGLMDLMNNVSRQQRR